jgi:pimeloyl-ACP methyl ester carboxylesterase
MNDAIIPFTLAVPQADLEDLNRRIDQTRWPDAETVDDWTQGAPLAKVKALVDHWRHRYDWRRCEATLNNWGQYKTSIDGLGIHFLHVRSKHENALPLIITHGWPGSVIEFMKIIGPLTDLTAHGGKAEDAFHVIVPSLPGHGFSDKATETSWGIPADRWRMDHADAAPRVHTLGRARRGLGLGGDHNHRRDETGWLRSDPRQHAAGVS